MSNFLNLQDIFSVDMKFDLKTYKYTNNFTVRFYPDKIMPDYSEISEAIKNSQKTIYHMEDIRIEDIVSFVYDILMKYEPKKLIVVSEVLNGNHFPVKVVKRSDNV